MIDRRDAIRFGAVLGASAILPPWASAAFAGGGARAFNWMPFPPSATGMTSEGLEGVRATVQKHIDANELTGAVTAIARHNKLAWYEAQGVRNVDTGAPLLRNDIFRLASSTKPLTAACILMLMDAGKLSIDDKVSRYIPTFRNPKVAVLPEGWEKIIFDFTKRDQLKTQVKLVPAEREVTIKDLLTHTAGVGTFFGVTGLTPSVVPSQTLADRIPLIGSVPLDFQPGTKWSYSPLDAFDILLRIVEIVSGSPADEFMKKRLFDPLGMTDTVFNVSAEQQARLVPLYKRENGAWKPDVDILGAGSPSLKYLSGAGGIVSTVHDYMQFQEMLLNRGTLNGRHILKAETVALMSTNHVGTLFEQFPLFGRKGWGFGLGVAIVLDPEVSGSGRGRGSFGWDGAHGTDGWVDPSNDLAAVYFVQQAVKPALADFGKAVTRAIAA